MTVQIKGGTNGTNGSAGSAGAGGESVTLEYAAGSTAPTELYATGGNGGQGGAGLAGTSSNINGGNGGGGGGGGRASASFDGGATSNSLKVVAVGGSGGTGGSGGAGYEDYENGIYGDGGNGGNGGFVQSVVAQILRVTATYSGSGNGGYELYASATGGAGGGGGGSGTGSGNQGYGGDGAAGETANAKIILTDISLADTSLRIFVRAVGGNGGPGGNFGGITGGPGQAVAQIANNDVTGSAQTELVTLEMQSGIAKAAGWSDQVTWLRMHENEVDLGGDDDKLTIKISTHDGGVVDCDTNVFNGGAGFDTLVLDGSILNALNVRTSGVTFNLALNTITGFERIEGSSNGDNIIADNSGMSIYGLAGGDALTGGTGSDYLDGGEGDDSMTGGAGNDVYVVDSGSDTVTEDAGGGADMVRSSVDYVLADNVERLDLTGTDDLKGTGNGGNNVLIGNSGSNELSGGLGDDYLDGGQGADTMIGGAGNDRYVVDRNDDVITEAEGEGWDTVWSSVSDFFLGKNLENLVLTGTAIRGYGNGADNRLTGNSANNGLAGLDGDDWLDGGVGSDALTGGDGNDLYFVDNDGDQVFEMFQSYYGLDEVRSTVTFSLTGTADGVEVLTLSGTGATNGTGNALANTITGNNAANRIDGGEGADTMQGGFGDDTYVVDDLNDVVVEKSNRGHDRVEASVTFSLGGQYGEDLTLTGSGATKAVGNSLANLLTGNDAANRLLGDAGDDHLHGGLGSDTLMGGTGLDSFWFETALGKTNVDKILDFTAADDTIRLDRSIFTEAGAAGTLAESAFVMGTKAGDADDRIVYDQATGNIFYDADGSGLGAAVLFAQVTAGTTLTYQDFSVYAPAA
jgi:Ca2+-binding RTX toxin-like protein